MSITEKRFRDRLRSSLTRKGLTVHISEGITKGFPDLLVHDKERKGSPTYYLELKISESKEQLEHIKHVERLQLYYLKHLHPSAFLVVHVISDSVAIYRVTDQYQLHLIEKVDTIDQLLNVIRDNC